MTAAKIKKNKLLLTLSILLVVGFMVTSVVSYLVSRASLRRDISEDGLPLTSDNVYSEIQRDLLAPVFISSTMANDTFLKDWVLAGELDETRIIKYLAAIQSRYNTFTSFFVSENTHKYYQSEKVLKTVSEDNERDAWYFRVKNMEEDYEINIDYDMAHDDAITVFVNYKVFDYDHNFIGATGVGLNAYEVKKLIEKYQQKYNRTIYLFDLNGKITISGTKLEDENHYISQIGFYDQIKDELPSLIVKTLSYEKDNEIIHVNIRYVEALSSYLVVEQSEEEAMAILVRTLMFNIIICVGITIIVLIIVAIVVHSYQNQVDTLSGIVPICSYCKQIRDDGGYWRKVEEYVASHSDAQFSHGICPDCMKKYFPDDMEDSDESLDNDKS